MTPRSFCSTLMSVELCVLCAASPSAHNRYNAICKNHKGQCVIPPKDSDSPDSAAIDAGHKPDSYRPGATAPFCLVTHFTQTSEDFPYIASKNHRAYAQAHGYGQNTYTGRISGAQFLNLSKGDISQVVGGGLYWQKITAVKSTLDEMVEGSQLRRYAWVMWLDADIIITHKARSLTEVLQQAIDSAAQASHESTHVILSSDASGPVNAGAFLIRNSLGQRMSTGGGHVID
ncbi:hypothetical protein Q3G72_031147 [Acer saccharum]|nr:hypothetical protein Q3G72_031147 [Acer saccharum]